MDRILCCPSCGSEDLEPFGKSSILDGKRRQKCAGCGQVLAPRRSRFLLCCLMGFALAVTGLCLALTIKGVFRLYLIAGIFTGPIVVVMSAMALVGQMPVSKSRF